MFNAVSASNDIKEEYIDYITTLFHIADPEYEKQFRAKLREHGAVTKGPYLDLSDSYQTGKNIAQMIEEGQLSPLFESLEGEIPDGEKELPIQRNLYLHQEKAIRRINQGKSLIVTTGTGSGKTECFVIPIINYLLREAERQELGPGVRAILIYPMNALANDQMKRLRKLLESYPEITFGVYNSSTQEDDEKGAAVYGEIYKDENGFPLNPLPNEIISRAKMQETPPNILVTNYAMLEYMLLRPKDDAVFSKAKLRFLVLDEAHTYRGATGMETSLLLKRLKARISDPSNVLHILTSATLGGKDSDDDIVSFASTLCDADFMAEDIIRAERIQPSYSNAQIQDIPLAAFEELAAAEKPLEEIAETYNIQFSPDQSDEEFLYDLCTSSSVYRRLRREVSRPMTIDEILHRINVRDGPDITDKDIVNIITVAEKAAKDGTALLKARYHMFARAMEGAYITIGSRKELFLERKHDLQVNGENQRVFECAVCDDCGRIAVTGKVNNGCLEFAGGSTDPNIEYYLLCDSRDGNSDDEIEGDEDPETEDNIGKNDFLLCSKCGAIIHKSHQSDLPCACGAEYYVHVRKARKTDIRGDGRCPCCSLGKFRTFYLGYDAATAVLGTALFETLPESERKLSRKRPSPDPEDDMFGTFEEQDPDNVVRRTRQFLAFSDSRGEAAYFASYMTDSYKEFLRRRGIWHVIEENADNMAENPWEINTFVKRLTAYFDSERTFAELPKRTGENRSNLTADSEENAWIAILNEMVNARRSTSLVSLGVMRFNFKGNTESRMKAFAQGYNINVKDAKALFDQLVMDIVYFGAIQGELGLRDDDKEYIFYTAAPKYVKDSKDTSTEKNKSTVAGWAATKRKNGSLQKNGRLIRTARALGVSDEEANNILKTYWKNVLVGTGELTAEKGTPYYFLQTDRFTISAGSDAVPVYKCNVCGKTSMYNCKNMCPSVKCSGTLRQVPQSELQDQNHYAKLYSSSLMKPLYIKEHTAQLSREEQQEYQEMFINKELNALSCSTTFELGVDVGDLETVYLRDMPPTPANYVQRAGRAGRSKDVAAFALTYAKLSSHDFTFYNNPIDTINGKIGVPMFSMKNKKVTLRHIFAVALSAFFAEQPDVYNRNKANVLLDGDGWERFCTYLQRKPEELRSILEASIPEDMHEEMGIENFSWTEELIGDDGVMKVAVEDFRETVAYLEENNMESTLKSYRKSKENDLIEFLVRNNILPKFGFPIDTVELHQNAHVNNGKKESQKLQMVRDLQLAVAEYAPGSQVVADGGLYTSRYIRKLPKTTGEDWQSVYIAKCTNPACETWNHRVIMPKDSEAECVSCHEKIGKWMPAIEPRQGFTAENKIKKVPMRKPTKAYRSDVFYIGDPLRKRIERYTFVTTEGHQFQMESTSNDSLMVVCTETFYVCPICGFSKSTAEKKGERKFNSHQSKIQEKHKNPWGKHCTGEDLKKYRLCHVFKTDVVQLTFSTEIAGNLETMLSVLYALLEAISAALDIERNDIDGCLYKVRYQQELIYSIILYDSVAGGAGHVRRLVSGNGATFEKVVRKALEITGNCKCDTSCYNCLRNYYNSNIHELLDRTKAYDFLQNFAGGFKPVEESADENE